MYFQQDWILRQIQMIVQFVAKSVFHKDSINYKINDEAKLSDTDILFIKLKDLVEEGKLCEAENMLFDNFKKDNKEYLRLALDFYQTINNMTDDELESYNFSRKEIHDGVNDITYKFLHIKYNPNVD